MAKHCFDCDEPLIEGQYVRRQRRRILSGESYSSSSTNKLSSRTYYRYVYVDVCKRCSRALKVRRVWTAILIIVVAVVALYFLVTQQPQKSAPSGPSSRSNASSAGGGAVVGNAASGVVSTPARAISRTHDCSTYYPDLSRRLHEEGDVLVQFEINDIGNSGNITVVTSSGSQALDDAAVKCVGDRWRFTPAMRGDTPIAQTGLRALVRFRLN